MAAANYLLTPICPRCGRVLLVPAGKREWFPVICEGAGACGWAGSATANLSSAVVDILQRRENPYLAERD